MAREVDYGCVKAITKELRKRFKGIQNNSFGYSCSADYDECHEHVNNNDYVCAKVYKGGMNNHYHDGKFDLGECVCFMWNLENFDTDKVFRAMEEVASEWEHVIFRPENPSQCIELWRKENTR